MRSRYSAYALGLADYLLATWHASTRPAQLDLSDSPRWIGLEVKAQQIIGPDRATVQFVARYKFAGRAGRMTETSRFVHEDGRWFYVEGAAESS